MLEVGGGCLCFPSLVWLRKVRCDEGGDSQRFFAGAFWHSGRLFPYLSDTHVTYYYGLPF